MSNTLLAQHIQRYVRISQSQLEGVLDFFDVQSLKKKQTILAEGQICKANYFVEKGLLRLFFVNAKGIEQTTYFALENWWISDYTSFESQKPAAFNIQTVEKSEVLCLSHKAQEELLQQYPVMESYFRLMFQRATAAAQYRLKYLYDTSREELYHEFNRKHPEFVQRVPQYLLASFLGFTPEYLSEIRAKRKS
ncbi:MAG: Crp/Fnr family transcriptional regulator [Sphingobacteriales bacterium]|nr:MAG: Crp/Fnr family transcriptional regulator [Sphingobacteriales bacterium]